MRPPPPARGPGILLPPDALAAQQPAVVAHPDGHAVRQREQVAVREPRRVGLAQVGLPPRPRLDVRRVVLVKPRLAWPERAVVTVIGPPVHWRVVGVADVDPDDAVALDLRLEEPEYLHQPLDVLPWVFLDPHARRHPLSPVGRRGHKHVNALIRQLGSKLGTVPKRNPINQIGTNLALPHPPSAPRPSECPTLVPAPSPGECVEIISRKRQKESGAW